MMKMKRSNTRGFTLVEIIVVMGLIVVVSAIFSINTVRILKRQRENENSNTEYIIKSAADSYVSSNPEVVHNLFDNYGYVVITVGELRNNGFLSEDLKDEKGNVVDDGVVIFAELGEGNQVTFGFENDGYESSERWSLVAQDLVVDYDEGMTSNTWCESNAVYSYLYDDTTKSKWDTLPSRLYFVDNSSDGKIYDGSYILGSNNTDSSKKTLNVSYCNVNPSLIGSYIIEYKYAYIVDGKTITGTKTRNVLVKPKMGDILYFEVVKFTDLPYKSTYSEIKNNLSTYLEITEYDRNGNSKVGNVNDYSIVESTIDTSTSTYKSNNINSVGTSTPRTATVVYNKTNSDGTKPKDVKASYNVSPNPYDVMSYTVTINNNPIDLRGTANYTINETYRNGTGTGNNNDYSVSGLTTATSTISNGVDTPRIATFSYNKTNSNGTRPNNVEVKYTVKSDIVTDMLKTKDANCIKDSSTGGCYFKSVQSSNYISYNDKIFRVFFVKDNNFKAIYNDVYRTDYYGIIGNNRGCENSGRYIYYGLGSSTTGIGNTVMDTHLNNFANWFNMNDTILAYQNVPEAVSNTSRKVSLMSYSDYSKIANCNGKTCNSSFLTGTKFWLVNSYSHNTYSYAYYSGSSVLNYAVLVNGNVDYIGKPANSNAQTEKAAIKPTLEFTNAKIKSGDGTESSPYVIG